MPSDSAQEAHGLSCRGEGSPKTYMHGSKMHANMSNLLASVFDVQQIQTVFMFLNQTALNGPNCWMVQTARELGVDPPGRMKYWLLEHCVVSTDQLSH
jgi:hypothetical protein